MPTAAIKLPPRKKAGRQKPRAEAPALLPAGTVLLDIAIEERCVPWKSPTVGKGRGFKDRRLVDWQATVRLYSDLNRKVREPYGGPVEVAVVAWFAKGPIPDATNCLKGIEDAMQGCVFINDTQVWRNSCERTRAGRDMVRITVRAADLPSPPGEDSA